MWHERNSQGIELCGPDIRYDYNTEELQTMALQSKCVLVLQSFCMYFLNWCIWYIFPLNKLHSKLLCSKKHLHFEILPGMHPLHRCMFYMAIWHTPYFSTILINEEDKKIIQKFSNKIIIRKHMGLHTFLKQFDFKYTQGIMIKVEMDKKSPPLLSHCELSRLSVWAGREGEQCYERWPNIGTEGQASPVPAGKSPGSSSRADSCDHSVTPATGPAWGSQW